MDALLAMEEASLQVDAGDGGGPISVFHRFLLTLRLCFNSFAGFFHAFQALWRPKLKSTAIIHIPD